MRNVIERIEELWCENMHTATMWPIHGKYRCGTCLREFHVVFDDVAETPLSRIHVPAAPRHSESLS